MSKKPAILVTGAGGEVGTGLIHALSEEGRFDVLGLDLRPLEPELERRCAHTLQGNVLDAHLFERLVSEWEIHAIIHLAALLSTSAEYKPAVAHAVNVNGTLNLLEHAVEQARAHGHAVKFLFPSSIAVYGVPDAETKRAAGAVTEEVFASPTTMYGCNKLYCEHLGRYYSRHYRQLAADASSPLVDFRCVRFPGLISAETMPTGGTSDYLPEMIHAAAKGEPYSCFVRPDTRIPFMAMPDAVAGVLRLLDADRESLSTTVYNIGAFSPSAEEFAALVREAFPGAEIDYAIHAKRQAIVDSWPADVDDSRARNDWGFEPRYDLERTVREYLVPNIVRRYRG
ncbi:MAG: NAD-dependent epimerase/dehydratase family protein [Planctomycetota bacterium]